MGICQRDTFVRARVRVNAGVRRSRTPRSRMTIVIRGQRPRNGCIDAFLLREHQAVLRVLVVDLLRKRVDRLPMDDVDVERIVVGVRMFWRAYVETTYDFCYSATVVCEWHEETFMSMHGTASSRQSVVARREEDRVVVDDALEACALSGSDIGLED